MRRLTFECKNGRPTWTRDGTRIVFISDREGDNGLFWQHADGSGSAERLAKAEPDIFFQSESWSPDGKVLIFDVGPKPFGVAMLAIGGDQKPQQLVRRTETARSCPLTVFLPIGQSVEEFSVRVHGSCGILYTSD